MATINSREIVDEIIAHNGQYPGDPQLVVKIVQYNNQWNGNLAYGLIYEGMDLNAYHDSLACHNPVTLWERSNA